MTCYNIVIVIRLISEVFANLLVIGLLFGMAGSNAYVLSIIVFSAATLLYSMLGGLHASLKTDVMQMSIFAAERRHVIAPGVSPRCCTQIELLRCS